MLQVPRLIIPNISTFFKHYISEVTLASSSFLVTLDNSWIAQCHWEDFSQLPMTAPKDTTVAFRPFGAVSMCKLCNHWEPFSQQERIVLQRTTSWVLCFVGKSVNVQHANLHFDSSWSTITKAQVCTQELCLDKFLQKMQNVLQEVTHPAIECNWSIWLNWNKARLLAYTVDVDSAVTWTYIKTSKHHRSDRKYNYANTHQNMQTESQGEKKQEQKQTQLHCCCTKTSYQPNLQWYE